MGTSGAVTIGRARWRRMLALAIPAMGALIADPLLGLVDTAVAARLGAGPLGALGLAVAVLAAVSWVFNFLVYGTTAAVARAVGAGDRAAAGRRVAHAGVTAAALGVVVAGLLLVTAPALLRATGAVSELIDPAVTYLRVRAVGVPFLLLSYVGHGAFRGVSDTRTPLVIVVVANVVNATLDVVLVFGFDAGLAGVAWATVAAEVITALALAAVLRRAGVPLRGHGRPTLEEVRDLGAVGRDLFLRTGALVVALLVIAAAAARIDVVTAAAHQVLWQVWVSVSFLMDGFAIAGQAMVGTALGAGDRVEARATVRMLVGWGLGTGAAVALLLLALVGVVPRLLVADPVVATAVASVWWLAQGSHVLNGLVFVLDGVVMGAGDFAYLRTWTVLAAIVAIVLAQVAVAAGWGLLGLWVALETMVLIRLVTLGLRVRGERWLRTGS